MNQPTRYGQHATALLEKLSFVEAQELKLRELETNHAESERPQEAATPTDQRTALQARQDAANATRREQKQLMADRDAALADAVALFPYCSPIVEKHFCKLYEDEKAKALAAIAPFFPADFKDPSVPLLGDGGLEKVVESFYTVWAARNNYLYFQEKLKASTAMETLTKFASIIKECGLHVADDVA